MYNSDNVRILIVDDEQFTREIFCRQLASQYQVDEAESATAALQKIEQIGYQIVMTDLVMPGEDGMELLKKIKAKWPEISVVMISGKASIETAVQAMKLGAEELIEKPLEDLELLNIITQKILKSKWQADEILRLRQKLETNFDRSHIIGNNIKVQKIMEKIKMVAPLDATVLLNGETGVGKEVFAELIYKNSDRKDKKFVAFNCGSLAENLLESALFGHAKGSFTSAVKDKIGYFEEANGGTLFLDEITDTSPAFQVKLLRALEKNVIRRVGGDKDIKIDTRIIAATNKDPLREVEAGNFREDLFYRLNVINITIPPLRERVDDIKLLSQEFCKNFAEKYHKPELSISDSAMSILASSPWKGNVRELKNAIEHAVAMAQHDKILAEDLPDALRQNTGQTTNSLGQLLHLPYAQAKNIFEEKYLQNLLELTKGEITKAAEISGIKRQNLYNKMGKYLLDPENFR
ncbi:MAG: sigma-54 dependent transcriptional regulator [Candidatus Cloacimonadales bacterium]